MKNNLLVRFLEKEEYREWDEFVPLTPQGCIFNYSWWLNCVCEGDFKILVILRDNKIQFGMPLPFFSTGVVQKPILSQTLGVLFLPFETEKLDKILDIQKKYIYMALEFLEGKINSYRMYFHNQFHYWLPFRWKGFKQTTRYTYRIGYDDYENCTDIFLNYSSNKKRNVNRAVDRGIQVEHGNDFNTFFNINAETFYRQNLQVPYSYQVFKALDEVLEREGKREIINAVLNNETIASAYYIFDNRSVYYLASGAMAQYRDLRAQDLLLDYGIKYFYKKVKFFDFEGSMIENIEKSFRAYGAEPTQYFEIRNDV